MLRWRSIVSVVLTLVAVMLVGCSGPVPEAVLPSVDPAKLEQIQSYVSKVEAFRERFDQLPALIAERNWSDTDSLIHGPLGDLRQTVNYLAHQLSPPQAMQLRDLSKNLFKELVKLDLAATTDDQAAVLSAFGRARQNFDQILVLLHS